MHDTQPPRPCKSATRPSPRNRSTPRCSSSVSPAATARQARAPECPCPRLPLSAHPPRSVRQAPADRELARFPQACRCCTSRPPCPPFSGWSARPPSSSWATRRSWSPASSPSTRAWRGSDRGGREGGVKRWDLHLICELRDETWGLKRGFVGPERDCAGEGRHQGDLDWNFRRAKMCTSGKRGLHSAKKLHAKGERPSISRLVVIKRRSACASSFGRVSYRLCDTHDRIVQNMQNAGQHPSCPAVPMSMS